MNKLAVISGGTKGIGLAIAHAFAREGLDIAVCSRHESDQQAMQAIWRNTYPQQQLLTFPADVSTPEGVQAFASFIMEHRPQVDVLVNNAGVFLPGHILEEPDGRLEQQIQTNLYSAYRLTRALIKAIPRHGHIFNIASIASFMAYPGGGSYTISKFAMLGFSKVLREELKSQYIKVTAVMPGATWSDSWKGDNLPPYERLMPPEDVAAMIVAAYRLGPSSVVEDIIIRPQLGDL